MVADKTILMIAQNLRLTAEKLEQLAQDNASAAEKGEILVYVMRITAEACVDTANIVNGALAVYAAAQHAAATAAAAPLSSVDGSN